MGNDGRAASGDGSAGGAGLYRYVQADGRLVFVDSLARVPEQLRRSAEPVQLRREAAEKSVLTGGGAGPLDVPSFAAGLGAGALGALLWLLLWRRSRRLGSLALTAGAVLLGAGAYLGWLGRVAGTRDSALATPSALIEDARAVVESMNRRNAEQQRLLNEIAAER